MCCSSFDIDDCMRDVCKVAVPHKPSPRIVSDLILANRVKNTVYCDVVLFEKHFGISIKRKNLCYEIWFSTHMTMCQLQVSSSRGRFTNMSPYATTLPL